MISVNGAGMWLAHYYHFQLVEALYTWVGLRTIQRALECTCMCSRIQICAARFAESRQEDRRTDDELTILWSIGLCLKGITSDNVAIILAKNADFPATTIRLTISRRPTHKCFGIDWRRFSVFPTVLFCSPGELEHATACEKPACLCHYFF